MSAPKPRVTIVGLGLIGSSIGLALREAQATSMVVGHDRERDVSLQGAVDRTDWNLISACEESDLVILATPLSGIETTLKAIAPYLKPGCVVLDTASIKEPVMAWAAETLPDTAHFVGGDPIVSGSVEGRGGPEAARADLFRNSVFCLVPPLEADEHPIQMAANLVSILGAKPIFFDAVEHDGLLAGVDHLPVIVSLALLEMAVDQPTWRELRKVAGSSFEMATRLAGADPGIYSDLADATRDNLVRWIDEFSAALASIRQALLEGDEDLSKRFDTALIERAKWLKDQESGQFDEGLRQELPERPSMMGMFLGGLWPRRERKKGSGAETDHA
jgi:prephenate dehydrogenase